MSRSCGLWPVGHAGPDWNLRDQRYRSGRHAHTHTVHTEVMASHSEHTSHTHSAWSDRHSNTNSSGTFHGCCTQRPRLMTEFWKFLLRWTWQQGERGGVGEELWGTGKHFSGVWLGRLTNDCSATNSTNSLQAKRRSKRAKSHYILVHFNDSHYSTSISLNVLFFHSLTEAWSWICNSLSLIGAEESSEQ